MKKILSFSLLFILPLIFILNTNFVLAVTDTSCNPTIKLVSQDPDPALPDNYVKVIFEITSLGGCDGFGVKLNPEYPFSLDPDTSAIQTIAADPYNVYYKSVWTIPYKIRIDSAAFDGDYHLRLQYHEGDDENFDSYTEKEFNLTIQDSRTNFDAVIQESTSSQVSIAIANTGKYTANSVIVRIPEQDDFVVTGTDGQMVGNLNSGDYSIVGFSIASKRTAGAYQNASRRQTINNSSIHTPQLTFDIYYTDNIGKRRVDSMALPLNMGGTGNFSQLAGNFGTRISTTSSSTSAWYSSWIFWIIIIGVFIIIYILYKKNPNRFKNFFKRKDFHHNSDFSKIPDWIRNAKEKEKKK
jgi:hypothetical protein